MNSINSRRNAEVYARESVHSINTSSESGVHKRGWIVWAAASMVCILVAALAIAFLVREARQVNTRPSAEIYFDNSSSIATWTAPRSVAFTFVIHNLARKAYDYRYDIYVTGGENRNTLIADEVLSLGPQQRMTIRQTIKTRDLSRFRVIVSLAGTTNTIFFWTQAPSSRSR